MDWSRSPPDPQFLNSLIFPLSPMQISETRARLMKRDVNAPVSHSYELLRKLSAMLQSHLLNLSSLSLTPFPFYRLAAYSIIAAIFHVA